MSRFRPKDTLNLYGGDAPQASQSRSSVRLHQVPGGASSFSISQEQAPPMTPLRNQHVQNTTAHQNDPGSSAQMSAIFGTPVRTSVKVHHQPGGHSTMSSILGGDDSCNAPTFRTNRSNLSHNVLNLTPEPHATHSRTGPAHRESEPFFDSREVVQSITEVSERENIPVDNSNEHHVDHAESLREVEKSTHKESFRTGRSNESHISFGSEPTASRTSVRVAYAPGGRTSGNIISWA